MRVLYFHQYFSTPQGASGIRSYAMARRLIERGHHVTMVCGTPNRGNTGLTGSFSNGLRRGTVDGIDVIELDLKYSNSYGFVKRAIIFIRFALRSIGIALRHDYDLIFATSTPLTAGIPGIMARWLRGKRFVFEVRDLWPELPREMGVITNPILLGLMSLLEWSTYKSAHRLIGLSPGIVEGIQRRGIPRERISLIPNGSDLDIFQPVKADNESLPWRPEGVDSGDLMAVFTGAHGIANGLDALIDAALVLRARGRRDIKLVLVGNGKMKPGLEQRAESAGLKNVLFLDPIPKHQLAGLMAEADLGLQVLANVPAFYYGTSPNKFFDYIAAGLPVLNNYPGWLASMINEYGCGFSVPPEDPQAFADALEEAADNRAALKRMGRRSRALAQERFDRRVLAERFVNWLEEEIDYL